MVIILSCIVIVISCTNNAGSRATAIAPRDTTITPKNAYTLLTLDSITVANFIATEQIVNEDAINIINFCSHRNYQYAWFDEEGLTEQGEAFWNLHQENVEAMKDSASSSKLLHSYMTRFIDVVKPEVKNDTLALIELLLTTHSFIVP